MARSVQTDRLRYGLPMGSNMSKIVTLGPKALAGLMQGVDLVADLVATSIGPAGRPVLVGQPYAGPILLRQGYAISQRIGLDDRAAQMGVQAIRELAWRTSDEVGDATCSTVLMARALLRGMMRSQTSGVAADALDAALSRHGGRLMEALQRLVTPVDSDETMQRIAIDAAGGAPAVGGRIADAYREVGRDGIVHVEEGAHAEDASTIRMGMCLEAGLASSQFVEDPVTGQVTVEDALVILHRGPLATLAPILSVLEAIAKAKRGLVIMADAFEGEALATLILNKKHAGLKVAAVQAPGVGAWRQLLVDDLAAATGATVVDAALGLSLERLHPSMAGRARTVVAGRRTTLVSGGAGDSTAIGQRVAEIRRQITRERYLTYDRDQHRRRLARFETGIATLRFGGRTQAELDHRRAAAESAAAAVRAALAGGVVPGGGTALVHAHRRVAATHAPQDLAERHAARIMEEAVEAPLRAILRNGLAGEADAAADRIRGDADDLCFDLAARCHRPAATLSDPYPAVAGALRNALSCARTLAGAAAAIYPAQVA